MYQAQTSLSTKVNRIVFSKTVPILRESNRFILDEDSELLNSVIIVYYVVLLIKTIIIILALIIIPYLKKYFLKGIQRATTIKSGRTTDVMI
jgi:hypothetical protein